MIHRQLIDDLTEWDKRENHKLFVLRGAHQIGKSI